MPRVDATSYIRYTLRTRRPVVSNERGSPMSPALVLQSLPWIVALVALLALLGVLLWRSPQARPSARPLPREWAISARPVFTSDERRVYRQLREALPHHIILAKLPLVRFCQPNDAQEVRYWYDLLGAIHVSFAVCSSNGRVLAAIDLDSERGVSRRVQQIKQSVLGACRVRHLRCASDQLPSIAELQLLVPQSGTVRGPQPASARALQRRTARDTATPRRGERQALWQDSSFFQDSFFAPDSREEPFASSEFQSQPGGPYGGAAPPPPPDDDDLGGVVVDTPPPPPGRR
jgi:hypothetical protein